MSDDFNKKLKQITEMLGASENMPENLSGLLSMLASSASKDQSPPPTSETETQKERAPFKINSHESLSQEKTVKEERNNNDLQENMEMLRKVKGIMDAMKNTNDPRINLLTAISPFLSNNRQKKIGNCIKMFQMAQITRLMNDSEKSI